MYVVGISGIVGYDSVVRIEETAYKPGDLIADTQGTFLCLGKDIIFSELYTKQRAKPFLLNNPSLIAKKLLSPHSISLIHWLVGQYFSSYKHVVGLFINDTTATKKDTGKKNDTLRKQECIIYPDLWALSQNHTLDSLPSTIAILHGGMTKVQKNKLFWGIKQGTITTLLATNRGLFFDWHNLTSIKIYNPTSRAYSNQSEPRFVIQEVAEKVGNIYGASIEYMQ